MAQLAERLSSLAETGEPITFGTVKLPQEVVRDQVAEVAAGPFAPLLAEAVVDALTDGGEWQDVVQSFAPGFANQRSLLALTSALETLLTSAATTQKLGNALNGVLLEGLTQAITDLPLLAAARLEGAVRLAVSGAVSPYRLWGILESLRPDEPEDFLESLPRILGVTLDRWSLEEASITATIRSLLEQLSQEEATDIDALFELGCDRLRSALASPEVSEIVVQLTEARRLFAAAADAGEARQDAEAYVAVCDAILGLTKRNVVQVAESAHQIELALEHRAAWLHRSHRAQWLQPRYSAEIAWGRLVLQLRAATEALDAPVWMEPWSALDTVMAAYRSARTVSPLGIPQEAPGLAALVEPAIEDHLIREGTFLAALRYAASHPDQHPNFSFDTETAITVLTKISAREPRDGEQSVQELADDDETGPAAQRLHRIAPTLVLLLGLRRALRVANELDDSALADIEGIAYNSDIARLKASDPLIVPLLDRFMRNLSEHPDFTGDVRHTFGALVEQTLLFLKSRSDLTRTSLFGPGKKDDPPYDYRRKPEKGQRTAVEADLQRDFHHWLLAGPLNGIALCEPIDVEMGRADVMVHFGTLHYLTEMKQDPDNNSRSHIEEKYLTQAAQYTNTNAPFGQLLILDLTPKTSTDGTRRIDEIAWITNHRPEGAIKDRTVLAGIVTGNRITPSAYSR
ncbi:hypothetical protein E1281_11720 [Actinomadura sp. KC345]|uniref:hypothetical protein n=1 Tax=Actinomadura sp. KC345 TaxID=2530371 RepID=UPI001053E65C|nr:hypothetical protein [Actinomadura sp. KC345]TDC55594.1 hypothetical protein E1281_11720 [Actinomadura sp. KC345]